MNSSLLKEGMYSLRYHIIVFRCNRVTAMVSNSEPKNRIESNSYCMRYVRLGKVEGIFYPTTKTDNNICIKNKIRLPNLELRER